MRVNAANDLDFAVLPKWGGRRVHIRMGWQRYTATPEEALQLARLLEDVVDQILHDHPPRSRSERDQYRRPGMTQAARTRQAAAMCQECPALDRCRDWADQQPPSALDGVVAGRFCAYVAVEQQRKWPNGIEVEL